jgi:Ca2+:H+ antiporter
VVKASLTGSILGNLLFVGGLSMLVGGWKRDRQKFNRLAAEDVQLLALYRLIAVAIDFRP